MRRPRQWRTKRATSPLDFPMTTFFLANRQRSPVRPGTLWHRGHAQNFMDQAINGLSFSAATRTLSGTPEAVGVWQLRYVVPRQRHLPQGGRPLPRPHQSASDGVVVRQPPTPAATRRLPSLPERGQPQTYSPAVVSSSWVKRTSPAEQYRRPKRTGIMGPTLCTSLGRAEKTNARSHQSGIRG